MAVKDTYLTIRAHSEGIFRDRGSRFIAKADPVKSAEEAKKLIEKYRKNYHDARHCCFAYMIGYEKNTWKIGDDGEPSGTAGKPILGQINSKALTDILIVVIRYFGGTLLGTGGLINAYRSAAAEALANSEILECTVNDYYQLKFAYDSLNDVMSIIKEEKLITIKPDFGLECSIVAGMRLSQAERLLARFRSVESLQLSFIERR
jgi:uncharacterized YigZ family protein